MKWPKITLLDLGGVVFQSSGISNDIIYWDVINSLNHKFGHNLNVGKDVYPRFMAEYNQRSGQELSGVDFLREVFDTLAINRELIEMVGRYGPIAIVSDNYRENIAYISKRYRFSEWAHRQFYSFDYGLVKSDPKFFERLVRDLPDYRPEEMLLIDDSPNKLASAERVGIRGIRFESNEQVRVALSRLGKPKI